MPGVLDRGLVDLGLDPGTEQAILLKRYIAELELWNKPYGLVNDSGDSLITRHILDCLAGLAPIAARNPERLADAGSGAGLPGLVLSIYLPKAKVCLVERSQKRCRFLQNQKALLGLGNLEIMEMDIADCRESFDIVCFRAFRPLEPPIIDQLIALLGPGAWLAAYKGREAAITTELAALADYQLERQIQALRVPGLDEERHLVWLRPIR